MSGSRRVEHERQPAVGDLAGLLDRLRADRAEVDRDPLLDRLGQQLQRLAEPVPPGERQRALARRRARAVSRASAVRTISTYSRVRASGPRERHAVPALGDLRARHAEAEPEAPAGEHVERRGGHRRRRRLAARGSASGPSRARPARSCRRAARAPRPRPGPTPRRSTPSRARARRRAPRARPAPRARTRASRRGRGRCASGERTSDTGRAFGSTRIRGRGPDPSPRRRRPSATSCARGSRRTIPGKEPEGDEAALRVPARLAAQAQRGRLGRALVAARSTAAAARRWSSRRSSTRRSCARGRPQLANVLGLAMGGPTVIAHGTEEQKERYLRADPVRRGDLVPGLLRARVRLRPGVAEDARGARRRRLGRHRPEGVDDVRARGEVVHARRAHRPRRAQAQGPDLLPDGHGAGRASRSGRCARSPARPSSTSSSSRRRASPTRTSSAARATAGRWRSPRSCTSARRWPSGSRSRSRSRSAS